MPQLAAMRLKFVSNEPADQQPSEEVQKRGNELFREMFALSRDGQAAQPEVLDRILRQGLAWTAEFGEKESQRRVLEEVRLQIKAMNAAAAK